MQPTIEAATTAAPTPDTRMRSMTLTTPASASPIGIRERLWAWLKRQLEID